MRVYLFYSCLLVAGGFVCLINNISQRTLKALAAIQDFSAREYLLTVIYRMMRTYCLRYEIIVLSHCLEIVIISISGCYCTETLLLKRWPLHNLL